MNEICTVCGLPKDLCVCESIAKEEQHIEVSVAKRRYGKLSTLISGLDEKTIDIKDLSKQLKSKLACGGTAKKGVIELQGNHVDRVRQELVHLGFNEHSIIAKRWEAKKK